MDNLREAKNLAWFVYEEVDGQFSDNIELNHRLAEAQAKTLELMGILEEIEPSPVQSLSV